MKKLVIIFILPLIFFLTHCESHEEYTIKLFSKRRWCPQTKNFRYLKPIINKAEGTLSNYFKVKYRSNGQIAEEKAFKKKNHPAGVWFYSTPEGKIVKEENYNKKGKLTDIRLNEYDLALKKKKDTHYVISKENKKKLKIQSHYFYNQKGKLIKQNNYNAAELDESLLFEYDSKDRLSKKLVFHYLNQLTNYVLYFYDTNNNKTKEEYYNNRELLIHLKKFDYNQKNQLVKITSLKVDEKGNQEKISSTLYEYANNGNLLKESLLNQKNVKQTERVYHYDKNNCKSGEEFFDGEGTIIEQLTY